MAFITKQMHAYLDYPVAFGLIAAPFVLGLGQTNPLAFYLAFATGIAALALTLLTDHQTGVMRVIPFNLHLAVDLAVGIVFVAAPFVLGFAGLDAAFYWVVGATVIAVVALNSSEPVPAVA